ncbi:MAG TPA: hypothetical protein VF240_05645 [Pyrinomonadaceae bacterium]
MTELLEKAFTAASKLSEEDQNALATMLLKDLAAEELWDGALANSQDKLAALADEALAEFGRGETKPLDEDL